jgi:hypothetical protein
MADGGFTVELDAELGARLKRAAEVAGRSVEDYAAELIAQGLHDDWAETRASLEHYDRTGEYVDADEALTKSRARLVERLDRAR